MPGGEAGREKVMLLPPPVMTKSSMVSAWAVRGRVKAEARRARGKRALRILGFPSFDSVDSGWIRMRPSGGGVKLGDWERFARGANAHRSSPHQQAGGDPD